MVFRLRHGWQWFIVLMVLSYFGSIIYFLFDEIDLGNRANKRHNGIFAQIRTKAAHLMEALKILTF